MIHQNQYPFIFLSLKDMNNDTFEDQIYKFSSLISKIIDKYENVLNSRSINAMQKKILKKYQNLESNQNELKESLFNLSNIFYQHYHQ